MVWTLPVSVEIGGAVYDINTDYRDILEIVSYLTSAEYDRETRSRIALSLFYDDFDTMPPECWGEAAQYLEWFLGRGEEDTGSRAKLVDWEQDYNMIADDINKTAHTEVRTLPYLHWFTYIGYFLSIGEGQLSGVVAIRDKLRKGKKLEPYERNFYRENRTRIDFKVAHSDAENDVLRQWGGAK